MKDYRDHGFEILGILIIATVILALIAVAISIIGFLAVEQTDDFTTNTINGTILILKLSAGFIAIVTIVNVLAYILGWMKVELPGLVKQWR